MKTKTIDKTGSAKNMAEETSTPRRVAYGDPPNLNGAPPGSCPKNPKRRRRCDYELFFDRHKPIQNKLANGCFDGCMFETFGQELEEVEKHDDQHIFTLVDVEGKSYASPGFHFVNRLGYFIVEIPWTYERRRYYTLF